MLEAITRVNGYYKESKGSKEEFIRILESHGYREGYNGYEIIPGGVVRVYVHAPDGYAGYQF